MFKNIGNKCKTVAQVLCWVGILASFILGLCSNNKLISTGIFIGGSFLSWVGSIGLYGIGEAVENSAIVANFVKKTDMEHE